MPRESLLGYMLRVTQANGYDSPWHIYRLANLQQDEMKTACLPAHRLASVLGQDAARLEAMSYTRTSARGETTFRIAEHDLGSGLITRPFRLVQPGLCPLCVRESGYVDAFWDLRMATACPFHRCKALMHCPTCQSPLRQFRPGPLICKCGADLGRVTPEIADATEVDLMRVLYAHLHGEYAILEGLTAGLPVADLLALPLRSLMVHVFRLGSFVHNERAGRLSAEDSVHAAAQLLADWPNGLTSYLRREMARRQAHETNFLKFYNRFYQRFAKKGSRRSGDELPWVRRVFLEFGVMEWDGEAIDSRLVAQTHVQRRRLTQTDLARTLGVDVRTMSRWLNAGVVHQTGYVRAKSKRCGVERDALDGVITPNSRGEVLETRIAAAYLGIPVSALQFLKENCLVGARDPRLQRPGYFRSDLDRVRRLLLNKARPLSPDAHHDPDSVLVLGRFLKFSHPGDKTIKGRLLAALLTDTIQALGRTGDQISSILLKKTDVGVLLCKESSGD